MNAADIVVVVLAAVFGALMTPLASKAIRDTPPDPEDDPPPVRRAGPWLEDRRLLGPLLGLVAAGVAAQTGMVGPMSTLLMGVVILGEPFTAWIAAGTVLVLVGIWLLARWR